MLTSPSGSGNLPDQNSNVYQVNNDGGISNIATSDGQISNINQTPIDRSSPSTIGVSDGFGYPTNDPNKQTTNNYASYGGVVSNRNENIQNNQNVGNSDSNYIENCADCEQQHTKVQSDTNQELNQTQNTNNNAVTDNSANVFQ